MTIDRTTTLRIGAVAIGRNEGDRLVECLQSLRGQVHQLVYVDSGSTDDSIKRAKDLGATVVQLDMNKPFTAARARNAGYTALTASKDIDLVQFVDGDCEMDPEWLSFASAFITQHSEVAVVCGRRRERFPDATIWNGIAEEEWAGGATGDVKACGGDALMRVEAFDAVSGFNERLIAGEEPELCLRMRAKGWKIWRLEQTMTHHDAQMTKFGQWWQRAKRAGYTYAEGVAMHGAAPERHNVDKLWRTLLWGLILPVVTLLGLLVSPWGSLLLLLWPLQVGRLSLKGMQPRSAVFLMIAKFAEFQGACLWVWRQFRQKEARLIEYK